MRHFWALFTWLDVLLAFGFVGVLVLHFLSARSWRDAVHERRFELLLVGLCASFLLLTPALPDELLADAFPGLLYRSVFDSCLAECGKHVASPGAARQLRQPSTSSLLSAQKAIRASFGTWPGDSVTPKNSAALDELAA